MNFTSQTQVNNSFHACDSYSSLNNFLDDAEVTINTFGKKIFTFKNAETNKIDISLNFNAIIDKGCQMNTGFKSLKSAKDRKIGKKLETKLQKLNKELDDKIKSSSFITRCFAFLRAFYSKLNPFSYRKEFSKNGFDRLNYYTEFEWSMELSAPLPKTPDHTMSTFNSTALYKSPSKRLDKKITNFVKYCFQSPPFWIIGATIGSLILINRFAENVNNQAKKTLTEITRICLTSKETADGIPHCYEGYEVPIPVEYTRILEQVN